MVADFPGPISAVFCSTPVPSISSACVTVPLLTTLNVYAPGLASATELGVSLYSVSLIVIVLAGGAAAGGGEL